MLVHPYQQLCQWCGRLPVYPTVACPSCGMLLAPPAPLVLPWPGPSYGQNPWAPYPPFRVAPQPPSYAPLVVEILLNIIGIYGAGWVILGKTGIGVVLLVCSLLLCPVLAVLAILTLGLSLLFLSPLALVAMICNIVLLQQAIKGKGASR